MKRIYLVALGQVCAPIANSTSGGPTVDYPWDDYPMVGIPQDGLQQDELPQETLLQ